MNQPHSNNRTVGRLVVACLAILSGAAFAAAPPAPTTPALSPDVDATPIVHASRMVTYLWTNQRSFAVRTLAGVNTVILPADGEKIEGFYLSATSGWHFLVTGDHRRVLLKPGEGGLYNTALMVTNKRSYELTLMSVGSTGTWYQRVTWDLPSASRTANGTFWVAPNQGAPSKADSDSAAAQAGLAGITLDPANLYFHYRIHGRAAFAPVAVFDNGRETWLRMNPKAQDMPAIFAVTDGKLDVVDYSRHGDYVVVPRVAHELILQLKNAKVTIKRACDPTRCLR